MRCSTPSHNHAWPSEGDLDIDACERYCQYCIGRGAQKEWRAATGLRGHVRSVHARFGGTHPDVKVLMRNKSKRHTIGTTVYDFTSGGEWYPSTRLVNPSIDRAAEVEAEERGAVTESHGEEQAERTQVTTSSSGEPSGRGAKRQALASNFTVDITADLEEVQQHVAASGSNVQRTLSRPESGPWPGPSVTSTIQQSHPTPSDDDLEIMEDAHAQLHLRQDQEIFDCFFLLVWHHFLHCNIPDLEHLCRTIHPRTTKLPPTLKVVVASFVNTYGSRIWPSKPAARSHLKTAWRLERTDRFNQAGGPVYPADGRVSTCAQDAWRARTGHIPPSFEIVAQSPLGEILGTYLLAALRRSLVDNGHMRVVMVDPKRCLHMILAADEDEPVALQPKPLMKQHCEVSGPLGEALRLEGGKPWHTEEFTETQVSCMLGDTGGMGGLPLNSSEAIKAIFSE